MPHCMKDAVAFPDILFFRDACKTRRRASERIPPKTPLPYATYYTPGFSVCQVLFQTFFKNFFKNFAR